MPPKKDKDPNKPKGRMSAYAFFVQTQRAEKKAKGEDVQFTVFSKECSEVWKDPDHEKQRYYDMAEKDRIRYEKEMSNYQPPPGSKKGRKSKKQKDPNQPKRAKSAFFFFSDEKRSKVKQESPGATVGDIAKKLGAAWKVMSEEQKAPYHKQADDQREEYKRAMEVYRKNASKRVEAEVDEEDEEEEYSDED